MQIRSDVLCGPGEPLHKLPPPQYKVKTDQCETAYWEECQDQTKKVPFEVG